MKTEPPIKFYKILLEIMIFLFFMLHNFINLFYLLEHNHILVIVYKVQ